MGSGVLLAALVVLWFVVLVPMVVTRGDAQGGRAELADSGRTLQRRRTVDPVVHADTERVSIDRDLLRTSGELQVDVHALRRRTLGGLVALAALALVGALVYSPWLWTAQVRPRPRRRRLRARAAQGRPPRAAGRPPGRPCRGPRGAAHRVRPAPVGARRSSTRPSRRRPADLPHPSVPLAPVHPVPRPAASSWPARRRRSAGSRAPWSVWTTTTSGSPTSTSTSRAGWPTPERPPPRLSGAAPVVAPGSRDGNLSA